VFSGAYADAPRWAMSQGVWGKLRTPNSELRTSELRTSELRTSEVRSSEFEVRSSMAVEPTMIDKETAASLAEDIPDNSTRKP
jgi:hypothetical protein